MLRDNPAVVPWCAPGQPTTQVPDLSSTLNRNDEGATGAAQGTLFLAATLRTVAVRFLCDGSLRDASIY
jgi:hypothetical protein